MKKERRCESCHAQVPPRTMSWIIIQRMTRAFVDSDWSLNSASRSCVAGHIISILCEKKYGGPICKKREETYTLENLLATDISQAVVEVADARGNLAERVLVVALNLARVADNHVELELDAAVGHGRRQPRGAARRGAGHEANLVVACLGGGEVEFARRGAGLGDDTVVVVEDFLLVLQVSMVSQAFVTIGVTSPFRCCMQDAETSGEERNVHRR